MSRRVRKLSKGVLVQGVALVPEDTHATAVRIIIEDAIVDLEAAAEALRHHSASSIVTEADIANMIHRVALRLDVAREIADVEEKHEDARFEARDQARKAGAERALKAEVAEIAARAPATETRVKVAAKTKAGAR